MLRDYARVAASRMASVAQEEFDDVIDEMLEPVLSRTRFEGLVEPSEIAQYLPQATRNAGCTCPSVRSPLLAFRVDPSGDVVVTPDTVDGATRERLTGLATGQPDALGPGRRDRSGLTTAPAGTLLPDPTVVVYLIAQNQRGERTPTYGLLLRPEAVGELLRGWYDDERLVPEAIVGSVPNDSVLHLSVVSPDGLPLFTSTTAPDPDLEAVVAVPEGPRFGDLAVHAAIRPEAASTLVIGGLPSSRLPLLGGLLALTLGIGAAALVQLRRERAFHRLREDFVSSVSHELRTPLAQIRLFSDLQEDGKLQSEADRKRARSVIAREARRLSHLVDNILQFSTLRRSFGQGFPREWLDLSAGIADGLDSVTPMLESREMTLVVDAEPDLTVKANAEALTRIVVNLLDNAIKYGPDGQTIRVVAADRDGSARLSVTDEGPGVPTAERERIWKAYRRLDRDVRAQIQGSGIGLAVVRDIVDVHGGRAWVEEAESGGARFVVEFPMAPVAV